jgi:hypothetical protein
MTGNVEHFANDYAGEFRGHRFDAVDLKTQHGQSMHECS